jgi:hypothetical protein
MTGFVSHLRKRLVAALEEPQFTKLNAPETWFEATRDSLAAIRGLAADEPLECIAVAAPEEPGFFDELQAAAREPERRFDLLTTRYVHPLNVAAPSEHRIREHLLERLMVADRSRIEQHDLREVKADDLLLPLNLVAIAACFTNDLRYLDALNYYYELLPASWYPESPHNWLRVSWVTFYARALTAHFTQLN